MAGIGKKISENMQLQEFVERCLSQVFNMAQDTELLGEEITDDICRDMGITEKEMYWLFEQLGYTRED